MSILENFANNVSARAQKAGWIEVVVPIVLPLIVELINRCFDKPDQLRSFAEGKRSQLQAAGLRLRCNQAVREAGVRGVLRVQRAGSALMDAVIDELDAGRETFGASADIYQQAFNEAASV